MRLADPTWIGVEDRADAEAAVGEPVVVGEGAAKVAGADDGDIPIGADLKDAAQLIDQVLDLIPRALFAELAEVREVFADLGRADPERVAHFMTGRHGLPDRLKMR